MLRRKIIIDTDCGTDDAVGILLALNDDNVELAAVTCAWGSTSVEQSARNVINLLDFVGASDIPVYVGAAEPLLRKRETAGHPGHSLDDAHIPDSARQPETTPAAVAIAQALGNKRPDEIWQLICLGPLTNIALALRLCPHLICNLGSTSIPGLVVMGGALEAKGNSGLASEFNFHSDPEAALIVTQCSGRPEPIPKNSRMTLVSWEVCLSCHIRWEDLDLLLGRVDGDIGSSSEVYRNTLRTFLRKIFEKFEEVSRRGNKSVCVLPDVVAVMTALHPAQFLQNAIDTFIVIELSSRLTRGCCAIDWYGTPQSRRRFGRWSNSQLVVEADSTEFSKHLFNLISKPSDRLLRAFT